MSAGNNRLTNRARISQAGFTLVEVMTVLVIIGLMSSAVVLTMTSSRPGLEDHSKQLVRAMNTLSDQALVTGQPVAMGLSKTQYSLMQYKDGQWERGAGQAFPEDVKAEFFIDGRAVKLSSNVQPLIIFDPVGLSTPFRLTLSNFETRRVIESKGDGRAALTGGS